MVLVLSVCADEEVPYLFTIFKVPNDPINIDLFALNAQGLTFVAFHPGVHQLHLDYFLLGYRSCPLLTAFLSPGLAVNFGHK